MDNTDYTPAVENETQSHGTENIVNEGEEESQEGDKETIDNEETRHKNEEMAHERENVSDENEAVSEHEERAPESEMPISDDMTEIESIMKKEPIEDITISPDIIIKEEYEDEEPSTNTVWVAEGLMEEDEAKYCIPSTSYMREEQLIKAVKDHPHLYDFSHQNYHNNSVCDNSWEIIGKQMGCSAEECKAKWNSLMEYYSKAVSSKKSSEETKKYKTWQLDEEMEFLRPFLMVQKDQTSNIKPLSECNKAEEDISERPSFKLLLQDSQCLKTGNEIKQESFTPMLDSVFKEYIGKKHKPQDHLAKFFQSMEATVRTLPPLLQVRIKSQISELVHNAEYEAVASCRNPYKPVPGPSPVLPTCSAFPNGPNILPQQLRPIVSSRTNTPVPNPQLSDYLTGLVDIPAVPFKRPLNKKQLFSHL